MHDHSFGEQLRRARRARKLTQVSLAQAAGVSQSYIAQIEAGRSYPSPSLSARISSVVGVDLQVERHTPALAATHLAEPDDLLGLAFTAAHDPGTAERPRLPVVGAAIPGDEDRMIIDGEPHGSVLAPPQLENVPGAHALYVRGRSMEPRYFSGELVYVDPQRRPNPGDFVLAVVREPNYSAPVGYVRRYLGERTGEFRLGTLQPKREYLIGRDALVRMHPIVGSSLL